MDIKSALEPTGKAVQNNNSMYYLAWRGGDLFHYEIGVKNGEALRRLSVKELFNNDWQPYREKPEIRPEKAGELWEYEGSKTFIYRNRSDGLLHVIRDQGGTNPVSYSNMIHGQNGWTRLYPPVPDENVEDIFCECGCKEKHADWCFAEPKIIIKSLNDAKDVMSYSNFHNDKFDRAIKVIELFCKEHNISIERDHPCK